MRKPDFRICKNKDADQHHGYREADQRLCFCYTDSTIHLLPIYEISSLWPSCVTVQYSLVCVGHGRKTRRPVFSQPGSYDIGLSKQCRPRAACFSMYKMSASIAQWLERHPSNPAVMRSSPGRGRTYMYLPC